MARKPRPPKKPQRPRKTKSTGKRPGLDEAQGKFAPADVIAAVFSAYEYKCAFTGKSLRGEAVVDPRGYLLNLSNDPLSEEPALLVPATLDAIFAFERGHLAIGPRYNFLVDLEYIDPEFAERLNPIGRLQLPSDPNFAPSLTALTPHLIAFATGRRSRS
jgi:hypothetical protein